MAHTILKLLSLCLLHASSSPIFYFPSFLFLSFLSFFPFKGPVPPIAVLRGQICPFISCKDFMELYQGHLAAGGASRGGSRRAPVGERRQGHVLILDTRTEREFVSGHLEVDTLHCPADAALQNRECTAQLAATLELWRGKHIVIVSNRETSAPEIGEALLKLHLPKIAILHGGASALRVQGLLTALGSAAGDENCVQLATEVASRRVSLGAGRPGSRANSLLE